jgi:predicted nucleotidyltransferase component of viral defense system
MIKQWLEQYKPKNQQEAELALREIMQEIALAGLQRSGFFEKAAFYGGTALRIFHGLDRFSEDMDFSLLQANPDFSFEPYLEGIVNESAALGIQVSIQEKIKVRKTNIDSAFLKSETIWKELVLDNIIAGAQQLLRPSIKIKLEVDTAPPLGFETEEKLLVKPFSFYVKCFTLPDLFAGKIHALLFRKWKQRVKGRDWYDMEWYIKKGVSLHLNHLLIRARESGDWQQKTMTQKQLMKLLQDKINQVSFSNIRDDINRFIPNNSVLDIWSANYFMELIKILQVK